MRVLWPQPDGVAHEKNRTDTQEERLQAWGPSVESGDRCCGSDVKRLWKAGNDHYLAECNDTLLIKTTF